MQVLCTSPRDPSLAGLPPRGSRDYLGALEALLAGAEDTVEIVCPFIDDVGARVLEVAHDASGGAAKWEVYTRTPPAKLLDAARRRGWLVYGYEGTPGEDENRGFHCKLFIADGSEAIVGSTNLIYTNLVENVEVGVFTDDEALVRQLSAVPRALRRASRVLASGGGDG